MTWVPFCSWYTQVTSRCWMPFSQVAEQGLHGPATHLPGRRKDSETNWVERPASPEGPPHSPPDLGPAERGGKMDAGRLTTGRGNNSRGSERASGLLSADIFLHTAAPRQMRLWSPTGHSPCRGITYPTHWSVGCEGTGRWPCPSRSSACGYVALPLPPPCPALCRDNSRSPCRGRQQ